jgi:uncharacterized protein YyaL (SSP411 family)
LRARRAELGGDLEARARQRRNNGEPLYTNRLLLESSPYLRQHAHNPVDWYAWGEEAFAAARRLNRPIFLSIGYSTCHWCHVMAEESFEDLEIARYLNENYIAIKVDREERPDLDSIYLAAVQAMVGEGGWPLNVFLTAEREPFFGGTYFPPHSRAHGETGLLELLRKLRELQRQEPARITQQAARVLQAISRSQLGESTERVGAVQIAAAVRFTASHFDPVFGGLRGERQKFPSELPIRLLLRYHRRSGDARALEMAMLTLEKLAAGGIRDHIGGGFHRYSTDPRWMVPHFEKMLYDNALLAGTYLEAYQVSGRSEFADVAREIFAYVSRDLTSAEGGFFAATDADSLDPSGARREGYYVTWTPAEVQVLLEPEEARLALAFYDITSMGNWHGRTILSTPRSLAEVAKALQLPTERTRTLLASGREKLLSARRRRPPPLRDEKIVTAWNGLMISAYARAALTLGSAQDESVDYLAMAVRAARFCLGRARQGERLLRSYAEGHAKGGAFLEDYAFLTAGLLDLFEASGDVEWLEAAVELDGVLAEQYEDGAHGGFYQTAADHERLVTREKPAEDGALPSGNSVAALNLLRLHQFTGKEAYRVRADRLFTGFAAVLAARPASLPWMLMAVDFRTDTVREIVLAYAHEAAELQAFTTIVGRGFFPNQVLVPAGPDGEGRARLERSVPLIKGKYAQAGRATAYVCEQRHCLLPTSEPTVLAAQLRGIARYPRAERRPSDEALLLHR